MSYFFEDPLGLFPVLTDLNQPLHRNYRYDHKFIASRYCSQIFLSADHHRPSYLLKTQPIYHQVLTDIHRISFSLPVFVEYFYQFN
jgi:hypothetical protein